MYRNALKMMVYLMRPHHIIYYLHLAYMNDVRVNPGETAPLVCLSASDLLPGETVDDGIKRKLNEHYNSMVNMRNNALSSSSVCIGLVSLLLTLAGLLLAFVGLALTLLSLG